eukprot:scaffold13589_cov64-Phaeocystis_antarctica.AAC.9
MLLSVRVGSPHRHKAPKRQVPEILVGVQLGFEFGNRGQLFDHSRHAEAAQGDDEQLLLSILKVAVSPLFDHRRHDGLSMPAIASVVRRHEGSSMPAIATLGRRHEGSVMPAIDRLGRRHLGWRHEGTSTTIARLVCWHEGSIMLAIVSLGWQHKGSVPDIVSRSRHPFCVHVRTPGTGIARIRVRVRKAGVWVVRVVAAWQHQQRCQQHAFIAIAFFSLCGGGIKI